MPKRGFELRGNPSRITAPGLKAAHFAGGTPCCHCGDPIFRSQSPQHEGQGRWRHRECERARAGAGIPLPLAHEVQTYVRSYQDEAADAEGFQGEIRAWQYRFWLRRFPHWPTVTSGSGRTADVLRRLDDIEDALTKCLMRREHASLRELEQSLALVCRRFEEVSDSTREGMAAFDDDDVAAWFHMGKQLGFIVVSEDQ
jgi:hypothetical protein